MKVVSIVLTLGFFGPFLKTLAIAGFIAITFSTLAKCSTKHERNNN